MAADSIVTVTILAVARTLFHSLHSALLLLLSLTHAPGLSDLSPDKETNQSCLAFIPGRPANLIS